MIARIIPAACCSLARVGEADLSFKHQKSPSYTSTFQRCPRLSFKSDRISVGGYYHGSVTPLVLLLHTQVVRHVEDSHIADRKVNTIQQSSTAWPSKPTHNTYLSDSLQQKSEKERICLGSSRLRCDLHWWRGGRLCWCHQSGTGRA